jgi:hypothetical protein
MKQIQTITVHDKRLLSQGGQTHDVRLDLVVPFTTPQLTQAALNAANRLGAGLHADIRLLKVQVVPFPLELKHSPIPINFLERQMRSFPSAMPTHGEIRLARENEAGLMSGLKKTSLVILATSKRPWRTRTERLASSLRRSGYTVVMVSDKDGSERESNA